MKHVRLTLALLLTAALASIVSCAPIDVAEPDADILRISRLSNVEVFAIREVVESSVELLLNRDFAAYDQFWVEDSVLLPMNHTRLVGREAIVRYAASSFPDGSKVTFSNWEFRGFGDRAWVTNVAVFSPPPSYDAPAVEQRVVVSRQDDGRWQVEEARWSYSLLD